MQLNQLIAVMASIKKRTSDAKTLLYKIAQKPDQFSGLTRTYSPQDEEGYTYPSENQKVLQDATGLLDNFARVCEDLWDSAYTQDLSNCEAKADLILDSGTVLAKDVPVTYLMFLEKQLQDVHTFVTCLPTLSINEDWYADSNSACYRTDAKQTTKTKKVQSFVIASEATEHHPAQIRDVTSDVIEGVWSTVKLSKALPQEDKDQLVSKVVELQACVIRARERANSMGIEKTQIANSIFEYLLD